MSASTIDRAANDPDLRKRVDAIVYKILATDVDKMNSEYGKRVRSGMGVPQTNAYYVVAVACEQQYLSGIYDGRGSPGHDEDVISDDAITAALLAAWPASDSADAVNDDDLDPARVLAIIREENPQAFELAVRRAIIERQREVIAQLHAATVTANGDAAAPPWSEAGWTS